MFLKDKEVVKDADSWKSELYLVKRYSDDL